VKELKFLKSHYSKQKENKERIKQLLLQECGVFKSRFEGHGYQGLQ
jgi:hypothetical protein